MSTSQDSATEIVYPEGTLEPVLREKSQRQRRLTEKGKAQNRDAFIKHHVSLKKFLDKVNVALRDYVPELELMENGIVIERDFQQLVNLHDSLRDDNEPDLEIMRAIDRLKAEKEQTIIKIKDRMAAHTSISARSVKSIQDYGPLQEQLSIRDDGSDRASVKSRSSTVSKIKESEAMVAVHTAELEAAKEIARGEEELERLQLEETRRRAEADAEIKKRKRVLEQQAIQRRLEAESAKVEAYREIEKSERGSVISSPANNIGKRQPASDMQALADAISASVRINHIPIVEPPVFAGDPLTYHDWKMSFQTLVDNKGLKDEEKIHYMKRYLAGPALQAVSGLFLLKGGHAFQKAKEILEERFGGPFIVAEAFRDKVEAWPKISSRDTKGIRAFADFLGQCKVAMSELPQLSILDDPRENRKLIQKLPEWMSNRWSRVVATTLTSHQRYPKFEEFATFIEGEAQVICNPFNTFLHKSDEGRQSKQMSTRSLATGSEGLLSYPVSKPICTHCHEEGHALTECQSFMRKSLTERRELVRRSGLCYGCLGRNHTSRQCKQRATCAVCSKGHPTCMHEYRVQSDSDCSETSSATSLKAGTKKIPCTTSQIVPVFVSTGEDDESVLTYALLDNQSDTSFITQSLADKLRTEKYEEILKIETITSTQRVKCQRLINLLVRGMREDKVITLKNVYTTKEIPHARNTIPTSENTKHWSHLERLPLQPLLDVEVGMLIGYDCTLALKPVQIAEGEDHEPYGVRTPLGWAVVGHGAERKTVMRCHRLKTSDGAVEDILTVMEQDFQDIKAPGYSQDDASLLKCLQQGIHQLPEGNLELPLPFKQRKVKLPDNRAMVVQRLHGLKKKFEKNRTFHQEYKEQMEIMLRQGDAERVPEDEVANCSWYIPHHAVIHPKKNKLRVVFDCSARYGGESLNDELLPGPNLLNSLVGVISRFRLDKVAICCDIERMFYCFSVNPEHRNFLRFLWWPDGDWKREPEAFRMKKHIFGATSSPGVANFALRYAANSSVVSQEAKDFICSNFYVDDGLASFDDPEKARRLICEARTACSIVNIRLHKFNCNDYSVLKAVAESERSNTGTVDIERVLGVEWNLVSDELCYRITLSDKPSTRRGILSCVASIYDPLGLISPFVFIGKKILQDMLLEHKGWDEPLREDMLARWERWRHSAPELNKIRVSRCFKRGLENGANVELMSFSDASQIGYGHCSYVRAVDDNGKVTVSLAMAKSRIAPSKVKTIPRLELQAAVLSTEVSSYLNREMNVIKKTCYFTDSQIVLAYLQNQSRRFHVYVANRVSKIQESTDVTQWHHVPSAENPADHASRGLFPCDLMSSNWFCGPEFLRQTEIDFQTFHTKLPEVDSLDPEVKHLALHVKTKEKEVSFIIRQIDISSCWTRVLNTIAYVSMFIDGLRKRRRLRGMSPSLEDLAHAEQLIVREFQKEYLTKDKELAPLDPFVDDHGLLRVGGRLRNSNLVDEEKHPVIIPKSSLALLLVRHHHKGIAHGGRYSTMNALRQRYWVIGAARTVASVVHKCIECRKYRGKTSSQMMADLPSERTTPSPPFFNTGLDCFGPFIVRDCRREVKRYGLLFTCLTCRAVHIEVLTDMTTDCFILSLRRFIAIRGQVKLIRCDHGTNFTGADRELRAAAREIDMRKVEHCLMSKQIQFKFNCPTASHAGGVWERQIRTVRSILQPLLKNHGQRLNTEDLRTLMYECMNIVNSRPLGVQSLTDPLSLPPITPNHLLQLKDPDVGPGGDFKDDVYGRKRWRRVQDLAQRFWVKWQSDYLANQTVRKKWQSAQRCIQAGDVVMVISEDPISRYSQLGRVTSVQPSRDGKVRQVTVQLANNALDASGRRTVEPTVLQRPVQKLVVLLENEVH